MSNPVILKELLTAYERWELPNLSSDNSGKPQRGKKKSDEPEVVLPTAAEIEEMQRQAREEGFQAGFQEGAQRMTALLNALEQALQLTDNQVTQDLLDLSLGIAQQMVQQVIKTKPEVLLNTIREAINSLPHFNQGAHLLLHPDDAALVRNSIGEQLSHSGWKIFEDAQIERGGVRVETAHSQIDASVKNRWQRIVASIGQDSSWIQE